jgi:hypothetical protein
MTKEELERLNIIELAVMCGKAAKSLDGDAAKTGLNLKSEWVGLVARETPSAADFQTHQQIQTEKAALKKRMVEYLLVAA